MVFVETDNLTPVLPLVRQRFSMTHQTTSKEKYPSEFFALSLQHFSGRISKRAKKTSFFFLFGKTALGDFY